MALWKEQSSNKKDSASVMTEPAPVSVPSITPKQEADMRTDYAPTPTNYDMPRRVNGIEPKESLIAAELSIEGKIDGAGHVRIAGRFTGDVHVQGNLTIEVGAKVTGSVRANTVIIAGELEGNVEDAVRVELLESGVITGDLKAGTLTVASGSRMRGRVEFGWAEKSGSSRSGLALENGSAL